MNPLARSVRAAVALCAVIGLAVSCAHQPDHREDPREIKETRRGIHDLVREADALERAGDRETARSYRQRAEALERRLVEQIEEHERGEQRRRGGGAERLRHVLHGLQQGIEALRAIDHDGEAEHLQEIAGAVARRLRGGDGRREGRQRREHGNPEREAIEREIEIMRVAMKPLLETDRERLAHLVEHAIHARELTLQRRRDDEALEVRESAPSLGDQAEVLALAARLLDERFEQPDHSEIVAGLARRLGERARRQRGREGGANHEREVAKRQLHLMRRALAAFREAKKGDLADLMQRAIRAAEIRLEGRRDDEAEQIVKRSPNRGALAELLGRASGLFAEQGHEEEAAALRRYAEQLGRRRDGQERGDGERRRDEERREQERRRDADRRRNEDRRRAGERARRAAALEERMQELQRALEEVRAELEGLRRRR